MSARYKAKDWSHSNDQRLKIDDITQRERFLGCCHVWMAPFMQGFFSTDVDRYGERSCVRPFDAVDVTAGLDEVRVPGP